MWVMRMKKKQKMIPWVPLLAQNPAVDQLAIRSDGQHTDQDQAHEVCEEPKVHVKTAKCFEMSISISKAIER